MTRIAIMQPTYLPWSGYFNLVSSVDLFIFLDDVQIERQSWQTRNRILVGGNEQLLSISIEKCSLSTQLRNVKLSKGGSSWFAKHIKSIDMGYPSIESETSILSKMNEAYEKHNYLVDYNIFIIKFLFELLDLEPRIFLSSELQLSSKRSLRLAQICEHFDATCYLSPVGAKEYLYSDRFSENTNVELIFQDYIPTAYPQRHASDFISHLSVIDVIGNKGTAFAQQYVRGNI